MLEVLLHFQHLLLEFNFGTLSAALWLAAKGDKQQRCKVRKDDTERKTAGDLLKQGSYGSDPILDDRQAEA